MSGNNSVRPPIAIDGPAGSGKSSVGNAFASRIGYRFLDTGLMYRAATWHAVQNEVDLNDGDAVSAAAEQMEFSVVDGVGGYNLILINGEDVTQYLHSTQVDDAVSTVSAVGRVREIMVAEQRRMAVEGEIVMVGRDIGTVVIPDAPLKIYLTASAQIRANRRHREFLAEGTEVRLADILSSIEQRDLVDSSRADSPLRPADDARVVDTDTMSLGDVVDHLVELAAEVI